MSNSNSPQSKITRRKTATASNKERRQNGSIKQYAIMVREGNLITLADTIPNKAEFLANVLHLYGAGILNNQGKII